MDNRGLVAAIRANCTVARITLRNAPVNADIPEVTRKAIVSAMGTAKDVLYANTMEFEGGRLLPNASFADINRDVGAAMVSYKQLLNSLDESKRGMFSVALWFDPVPDPNGFGAFPETVANKLAAGVENRIVKAFDTGIERHLEGLNVALRLYVQRVGDYHVYMNASQDGKRRVIIRDATILSVQQFVSTLQRLNVDGSARVQRICDSLMEVMASTPDMLRKDALKRERCILQARNAIGPEAPPVRIIPQPEPVPAPLPEPQDEEEYYGEFEGEDAPAEQIFDPTT